MTSPRPSSFRRDVLSAYFASGSRVVSWVVVTAVVYRRLGPDWFAVLALVWSTLGLLDYTTLGLAPAMIRLMAAAKPRAVIPTPESTSLLDYESVPPLSEASVVWSSAVALAVLLALAGLFLTRLYAAFFTTIHNVPRDPAMFDLRGFVFVMGLGAVMRLASDSAGAALQVRHRIATDNLLLAASELLWMVLCLWWVGPLEEHLNAVARAWFVSSLLLVLARSHFAQLAMGRGTFTFAAIRLRTIRQLLSFGLFVAAAQAADFLYAPTDNILINKLINPVTVAVYAPAIQIDTGLLLLVGGLASVLLPRTALAHAGGNAAAVRRYYILGTTASIALLIPAALCAWLLAPILFRLWLHDPMTATLAVLPLVLIHTVVGGSSAVGRSLLLAVGKVKPFTVAVLIAGAGNVILSYIFVRYCAMGLRGIILGTIIAVIGRCAIWTPWYVLRVLRIRPE